MVERAGVDPGEVDDVIVGCLDQVGEQSVNIGRSAVLGAGFPESVPATTIDRQCGSSQQAAHFAAQGVMAGVYDIVIAAGVESMTRVPMWANVPDPATAYGPRFRERYGLAADAFIDQGICGEMIAERFELTREELDAFALASHLRAAAATDEGRFEAEILPVRAEREDRVWTATADEGIRPGTTLEKLAGLRRVFREDGRLTAATCSQLSDGAAAVLIVSERAATRLGLRPLARFHSFALVGVDPIEALRARSRAPARSSSGPDWRWRTSISSRSARPLRRCPLHGLATSAPTSSGSTSTAVRSRSAIRWGAAVPAS